MKFDFPGQNHGIFFLLLNRINTNRMSFKEIQKKIRLLPGVSALVINAPLEYVELMSPANFDIQVEKSKRGKYNFVQVFGSKKSILEQLVWDLSHAGKYDCLFWICYPKGGGKIKSDINRNIVWKIAEGIGMKCVSQIAIDDTWSALRCRPAEMVGK
jgi:hypothetical protein